MHKLWLGVGVVAVLLSACTTPITEQQVPPQPYNGPVVEIDGVEPQYEPYNLDNMQDYQVNGETYRIVKDPQNFTQSGLASWYGDEANGNTTALGEQFDANALTAAHPTLPIPSYVRVTNLANGRQLVVRVNDRGPFTQGRIIDLSKAAADRLNLSNNTKVKVDFISVAQDGTLSGPGTIGTLVAKQSYALPARPDLGSSGMGTPMQQDVPVASGVTVHPIDNGSLKPGAPSVVSASVLEDSVPDAAAAVAAGASTGGYVVQVGALSSVERAQSWQQSLSKQFGVPGIVAASGNVYRVQLGRFSSRQQAAQLQQRLAAEAQQQSFVTPAP